MLRWPAMSEEHETKPKKRATEAGAAKEAPKASSTRKKAAEATAAPSDRERTKAAKTPEKKGSARKPPAGRPATDGGPPAEEAVSAQVAARPAQEELTPGAVTSDDTVADNPLHKKLGLRPDSVALVVAPPEGDDSPLLPLPESVTVLAGLDEVSALAGPFDYIHVFARNRGDLAGAFATLRDRLAPGGSLWVSWMKQSSDRRRGTFTDLNETIIRRIALTHGMVDVKVVALDRDWSALRLVLRKH
jgi:hypothetical protein